MGLMQHLVCAKVRPSRLLGHGWNRCARTAPEFGAVFSWLGEPTTVQHGFWV